MKTRAEPAQMIFVAGAEGAGKSFTVRMLEDMGLRGIDNLPLPLLQGLVDHVAENVHTDRIVVGVEAGSAATPESLLRALETARSRGIQVKLVLLDAPPQVLAARRSMKARDERRRTGEPGKRDARLEETEQDFIDSVREHADLTMDTSAVSIRESRDRLRLLADSVPPGFRTPVAIESFGFKYGPCGADIVFDVRFLPNPYYVPHLRPLCGKDASCARYVLGHHSAKFFLDSTSALIAYLVPEFSAQGRSRLTVGVGCTGGQHRSVAIAEALSRRLCSEGIGTVVEHREAATWEDFAGQDAEATAIDLDAGAIDG